jgi:cell division control protein 7
MHALLEQALILGKATMEECAALHCMTFTPPPIAYLIGFLGRTFATNIPEIQDRTSWTDFVKRLNPDLVAGEPIPSPPRTDEEAEEAKRRRLVTEACDLLERCLEPLSVDRITAHEALYHPFLAPDMEELIAAQANPDHPIELDEDELFPHPPGSGICGNHHDLTKNGDCIVFVGYDEKGEEEWEHIAAGQGQAIGTKPCEFHEGFYN